MTLNRREWLAGVAGAIAVGSIKADEPSPALPEPLPSKLPRWRGFNLLSFFNVGNKQPFPEEDFAAVAEFGFNFVRLPMDYRCWTDSNDWTKLKEDDLKIVDQAVKFGEKHGVHVQLNFHRAPGYTVASPPEQKSLWTDPEALDVCCQHWAHFATRYQGVPNRLVDFNLFNEPNNNVLPEQHRKVVERVAAAIREVDPGRLIVCDGRAWARTPPTELKGLNVAAALHGYEPMPVTHYKASWVGGSDRWEEPTWPLRQRGQVIDRETLRKEQVEPWKDFENQGFGVHVGEFGCHNKTPHPVVLAWMKDCLDSWNEAGWGWTLWNLRGSFGVLDSNRQDVSYESWRGHQLDRPMIDLLQKS